MALLRLLWCALLPLLVSGDNPLIRDPAFCQATGGPGGMCGVADANVHFFDNQFMMFATHDFSINNTGFRMDDWQVWSSPDLVDWVPESTVHPQTLTWDTQHTECWATDAAWTGGKYYFYVSAGGGQVGVMVADSPKGPWSDPIGKPLLSTAMGKALDPPTTFRDPCVFNEPGTDEWYIIAGVFTYYISKLSNDMTSLAETPRLVSFTNHVYGPCGDGKTDDKPFIHKMDETYYLSWGCFYATSSSIYGPFTMQGAVIDTAKIAPDFQCDQQPNQCGADQQLLTTAPQQARAEALSLYDLQPAPTKPWYLHEDYTDRHGSFVTHGGQWYYFSNDRSHSGDVGHEGSFRDTVGCYIHFRANHTMESCVINAQGVNQHDLSHGSVVEAENFFWMEGAVAAKIDLQTAGGGDGFAVGGGAGASWRYPHVAGIGANHTSVFTLRVASVGNATIQIYANLTSVFLLASCDVPSTGGLAVFAEVSCGWSQLHRAVSTLSGGEVELQMVVRSPSVQAGEVVRVDKFWIDEPLTLRTT